MKLTLKIQEQRDKNDACVVNICDRDEMAKRICFVVKNNSIKANLHAFL